MPKLLTGFRPEPNFVERKEKFSYEAYSSVDTVSHILNEVIKRLPGSYWWKTVLPNQTRYWLRITVDSLGSGSNRQILGKLQILRNCQSSVIAGIQLTSSILTDVIFIETLHRSTSAHWRVLWADCGRPVRLRPFTSGGVTTTSTIVQEDPVQLGPEVQIDGWVSGRNYSQTAGVEYDSAAYSWCFLVPLHIDRLSYACVLLLPPKAAQTCSAHCTCVDPPTHSVGSAHNYHSPLDDRICHEFGKRVNETNNTKHTVLENISAYCSSGKREKLANVCNFDTTTWSPLSPLFEPSSRLVMLIEERAPLVLTHNQPRPPRAHSVERLHSSYNDSSETSNCSVSTESPSHSPYSTHDQPNCYTYIKTKDGQPAYTNGATISPRKFDRDWCPAFTDKASTQKQLVSHFKRGAFMDPSTLSTVESSSIHQAFARRAQKSYMLKELDVICSEDAIPPPWIMKLKDENHVKNPSFDRSWSTIGTADSIPHDDLFTESAQPTNEVISDLECHPNVPVTTESLSVSTTDPDDIQRTSTLTEIMGQLNALTEDVVTVGARGLSGDDQRPSVVDNRRISDQCKHILHRLSSLYEDEEEEEDGNESDRPTSNNRTSRKQKSVQSNGALATIGNPLPVNSRITSPVRLLICYFEILSEMADLLADEHKVHRTCERQRLELLDVTRDILQTVSNSNETETESNVNELRFKLWLLSDVRDTFVNSYLSIGSSCDHKTKKLFIARVNQIQDSLENCYDGLKTMVSRDVSDGFSMSQQPVHQIGKNYIETVNTLLKNLFLFLSNTKKDSTWLDQVCKSSIEWPQVLEKPVAQQSQMFDAQANLVQLFHNCKQDAMRLQKYLAVPWLPVDQWDFTTNIDASQVDVLIAWHDSELEQWSHLSDFLKEHYNPLAAQAVQLERLAEHSPVVHRRADVKRLAAEMRELRNKAIERNALSEFFQLLCRLPSGMTALLNGMKHLTEQIREEPSKQNPSNRMSVELSIRQLQHQLCVECSFLHTLFTKCPPDSGLANGLSWLSVWTEHISESYHQLVREWERTKWQRRVSEITRSVQTWIECADGCIDAITGDTDGGPSAEQMLNNADFFPLLWTLLCDADLISETAWHVRQQSPIPTMKDDIAHSEEFHSHLAELNMYLDFVIDECVENKSLVPILLQRMEQSLRDTRTRRIQLCLDSAANPDWNDSADVDKLRSLMGQLRSYQSYWIRRFRLTQRAINVASDAQLSDSNTRFVQHWTVSMSLRRDWQIRLLRSLNRIIRAGELVSIERFPLRSVQSFAVHLNQKELLRREQIFLESLRLGLDSVHMESVILREGLAVCDPQSASSPISSSLNSTLEELKHLFTRMFHDPRLGHSTNLTMPRDIFSTYIRSRTKETTKLLSVIKLSVQAEWELAILTESSAIQVRDKIRPDVSPGEHLQRLSEELDKLNDEGQLKTVKVSAYTAGFSWTPIPFHRPPPAFVLATDKDPVDYLLTHTKQITLEFQDYLKCLRITPFDVGILRTDQSLQSGSESLGQQDEISKQQTQLGIDEVNDPIKMQVLLDRSIRHPNEEGNKSHVPLHCDKRRMEQLWMMVLSQPNSDRLLSDYFDQLMVSWKAAADQVDLIACRDSNEQCEQLTLLALATQPIHLMVDSLRQTLRLISTETVLPDWLERLAILSSQLYSCLPLSVDQDTGGSSVLLSHIEEELHRLLVNPSVFRSDDLRLSNLFVQIQLAQWLEKSKVQSCQNVLDNSPKEDGFRAANERSDRLLRCLNLTRKWLDLGESICVHLDDVLSSTQESVTNGSSLIHLKTALYKFDALEAQFTEVLGQIQEDFPHTSSNYFHNRLRLGQQLLKELVKLRQINSLPSAPRPRTVNRIRHSECLVIELLQRLRSLLFTQSSPKSDDPKGSMPFDLSLFLADENDLTWSTNQLNLLEKLCDSLRSQLAEELTPYRVDVTELRLNSKGIANAAGLLDLFVKLGAVVPEGQGIRQRTGELLDRTSKLRNLIGAFSDHAKDLKSTQNQLRLALPKLTGLHLDELVRAVDELEAMSSVSRTVRSEPPANQLASNIKHAGQRLMELETCLEHAVEATRTLILLGRGAKFWSSDGDTSSVPIEERIMAIQNEYERLSICPQLRAAWTTLARLGDRLGRIQAGLPARHSPDSRAGTLDDIRSEDELPDFENGSPDYFGTVSAENTNQRSYSFTSSSQIDAQDVRRRHLYLRDFLGSHDCVYPECKLAKEQWSSGNESASSTQVTIDEKLRTTFVSLVHFYTRLRKNLIEQLNRSTTMPSKLSNDSIQQPSISESEIRSRWHRNDAICKEFQDLMQSVEEYKNCDLPQLQRILTKAESLERLWQGSVFIGGPHREPSILTTPVEGDISSTDYHSFSGTSRGLEHPNDSENTTHSLSIQTDNFPHKVSSGIDSICSTELPPSKVDIGNLTDLRLCDPTESSSMYNAKVVPFKTPIFSEDSSKPTNVSAIPNVISPQSNKNSSTRTSTSKSKENTTVSRKTLNPLLLSNATCITEMHQIQRSRRKRSKKKRGKNIPHLTNGSFQSDVVNEELHDISSGFTVPIGEDSVSSGELPLIHENTYELRFESLDPHRTGTYESVQLASCQTSSDSEFVNGNDSDKYQRSQKDVISSEEILLEEIPVTEALSSQQPTVTENCNFTPIGSGSACLKPLATSSPATLSHHPPLPITDGYTNDPSDIRMNLITSTDSGARPTRMNVVDEKNQILTPVVENELSGMNLVTGELGRTVLSMNDAEDDVENSSWIPTNESSIPIENNYTVGTVDNDSAWITVAKRRGESLPITGGNLSHTVGQDSYSIVLHADSKKDTETDKTLFRELLNPTGYSSEPTTVQPIKSVEPVVRSNRNDFLNALDNAKSSGHLKIIRESGIPNFPDSTRSTKSLNNPDVETNQIDQSTAVFEKPFQPNLLMNSGDLQTLEINGKFDSSPVICTENDGSKTTGSILLTDVRCMQQRDDLLGPNAPTLDECPSVYPGKFYPSTDALPFPSGDTSDPCTHEHTGDRDLTGRLSATGRSFLSCNESLKRPEYLLGTDVYINGIELSPVPNDVMECDIPKRLDKSSYQDEGITTFSKLTSVSEQNGQRKIRRAKRRGKLCQVAYFAPLMENLTSRATTVACSGSRNVLDNDYSNMSKDPATSGPSPEFKSFLCAVNRSLVSDDPDSEKTHTSQRVHFDETREPISTQTESTNTKDSSEFNGMAIFKGNYCTSGNVSTKTNVSVLDSRLSTCCPSEQLVVPETSSSDYVSTGFGGLSTCNAPRETDSQKSNSSNCQMRRQSVCENLLVTGVPSFGCSSVDDDNVAKPIPIHDGRCANLGYLNPNGHNAHATSDDSSVFVLGSTNSEVSKQTHFMQNFQSDEVNTGSYHNKPLDQSCNSLSSSEGPVSVCLSCSISDDNSPSKVGVFCTHSQDSSIQKMQANDLPFLVAPKLHSTHGIEKEKYGDTDIPESRIILTNRQCFNKASVPIKNAAAMTYQEGSPNSLLTFQWASEGSSPSSPQTGRFRTQNSLTQEADKWHGWTDLQSSKRSLPLADSVAHVGVQTYGSDSGHSRGSLVIPKRPDIQFLLITDRSSQTEDQYIKFGLFRSNSVRDLTDCDRNKSAFVNYNEDKYTQFVSADFDAHTIKPQNSFNSWKERWHIKQEAWCSEKRDAVERPARGIRQKNRTNEVDAISSVSQTHRRHHSLESTLRNVSRERKASTTVSHTVMWPPWTGPWSTVPVAAKESLRSVPQPSSACRYLLPVLALLLLLLTGLLLVCLLMHSTCHAFFPWTRRCAEQTFVWRLFYQPLRTLRLRRPPL